MKKVSHWSVLLSLLLLSAGEAKFSRLGVAGIATPAPLAQSESPENNPASQTVQTPASLCRRVTARQGLAVREKPEPNSLRLGGVTFNTQVRLAEGARNIKGSDGRVWIEIAAPLSGYIASGYPNSETNLGPCSGTVTTPPQTPPAGNLCRQVEPRVAPKGLAVRAQATQLSAYRGGIPANGRVTLVENYRLVLDTSGANRNWVEISAPIRGFVSAQSLIMCR